MWTFATGRFALAAFVGILFILAPEIPVRAADPVPAVVYGGLPVATAENARFVLIDNEVFEVGYSEYRQDPVWVGYRVGPRKIPGKLRRPAVFSTDTRTTARITHRDYTWSGYDRGHMAPNHAIASRYGKKAQMATFLMSNIVPQKPALNRQVWRRLEEIESGRWAVDLDGVWVITGPVFDDQRTFLKKMAPRIDIPDAFFKVIIDEVPADRPDGTPVPRVIAFIVPQDVNGREPIEKFIVSVDRVEEVTGLDLMPDLPDQLEDRLESGVAGRLW